MYKSPIKVSQGNLEMQFEGEILKAVQRVDITVDKDELIRALRYDREQYQKGFDDARKGAVPVVRCKDCKWFADNNDGYWFGCWLFQTIQIVPEDTPKPDDFCSYGERKDGGAENG